MNFAILLQQIGEIHVNDQQLRDAGLKVTSQRMKILQILEDTSHRHLSAEDIYRIFLDMGEDIGLATVYRVLTQFESAGIVTRHYFEGGNSVFELNKGEHHDHLVCVKCGSVEEFVDETIEARQTAIAKKAQFRMTDHSLIIYGMCKHCVGLEKK